MRPRPSSDAWLAGFADGEGCFGLYRTHGGFAPRFTIQLRADVVAAFEAVPAGGG